MKTWIFENLIELYEFRSFEMFMLIECVWNRNDFWVVLSYWIISWRFFRKDEVIDSVGWLRCFDSFNLVCFGAIVIIQVALWYWDFTESGDY